MSAESAVALLHLAAYTVREAERELARDQEFKIDELDEPMDAAQQIAADRRRLEAAAELDEQAKRINSLLIVQKGR